MLENIWQFVWIFTNFLSVIYFDVLCNYSLSSDFTIQGAIVYDANCGTLSAPGYFDVSAQTGDINTIASVATDLAMTYEVWVLQTTPSFVILFKWKKIKGETEQKYI